MKLKIFGTIFIILLILSIYLASAYYTFFNFGFYKKEFAKNNVYDHLKDADKIGLSIINFFKGKNELPNVFTEDESMHMIDVRNLVNNGKIFLRILILINILVLSLFIFYNSKKYISRLFIFAGTIGLILPFTLFLVPFKIIFTRFHYIFFPQGNWTFPADSALITLFPQELFFDGLVIIVIYACLINIFLIILGMFSSKIGSNKIIFLTTQKFIKMLRIFK